MTTPQEARELAEHYADTSLAKSTLRSLASQVEALTAENAQIRELMNMYNLGGWTDSLTLMQERDSYKKDAERYRWLRAGNYSIALSCSILNDTPHGIDKTIDAAIAKETA